MTIDVCLNSCNFYTWLAEHPVEGSVHWREGPGIRMYKVVYTEGAHFFKAVAILPSTAIYPQRLFCRELFVIGQS